MAPRALIVLADGFEEIEAITPIDLLRRGGVEVVTAGLAGPRATGKHHIAVAADTALDMVPADALFDALILPGGPGTALLRESPRVLSLVRAHHAAGRLVAAICAAPTVLARAGVLAGRRAACYPSVEPEIAAAAASVLHQSVVIDGHLITSRGAGTAIPFALACLAALCGTPVAHNVAQSIIYNDSPAVPT